jgi:hypothetical protein
MLSLKETEKQSKDLSIKEDMKKNQDYLEVVGKIKKFLKKIQNKDNLNNFNIIVSKKNYKLLLLQLFLTNIN